MGVALVGGRGREGEVGEDERVTIEDCIGCAYRECLIDEGEEGQLLAEVGRLRAVEAAARAFRLSELRLLNYRDPHYPQHEADHLAARRALRDALGDSDS